MIIKKNYLDRGPDYLQEEKEGLDKAIKNLDRRFQNKEIDRDDFFKDLNVFQKRSEDLKKRMEKISRK